MCKCGTSFVLSPALILFVSAGFVSDSGDP